MDRTAIFEKALFSYLDTYFVKRDLKGTLEFLSDNMTGFGTGFDEFAYEMEPFADLYVRDIESVPDPIHYNIKKMKIIQISDDIAVTLCQMDISGMISDQKFSLNHLRQTLILSYRDERVFIEHKHISFPSEVHEEDEPYPLKEIEDIRKKLDAIVLEKTRTLLDAYKELETVVITDKLTQLFNRNKIDDFLKSEINRSFRYGKKFSVIILDIDHFKNVNDNFGHLFGDKVLVKIAEALKSSIRNTDLAGRWGGEELIIILPETSVIEAVRMAEKFRKKITSIKFEENCLITASFGVAEYSKGDEEDSLLKKVDENLYRAKSQGRNCVVF